jgi:hypothetical protein
LAWVYKLISLKLSENLAFFSSTERERKSIFIAKITSEGRTRIWGFRPPDPPLRGRDASPQTPLRKG